ncbi:MAG TPA: NUDIX domain-containing protein [Candidatus Nanoarchaeia archaeon]|nr:NUDIX domain-containing protein [Candidatus Nanoarchaeia archaeon]
MGEIVIIIVQKYEKLYVHQRSSKKKVDPSLFGLGAGGKVEPGESPLEAAARELDEELEIKKRPEELEKLFDFPFPERNYHVHVFRTCHYGEINPRTAEFQWGGWMNCSEIDPLAEQGKLCPDTKIAYERFKREKMT